MLVDFSLVFTFKSQLGIYQLKYEFAINYMRSTGGHPKRRVSAFCNTMREQ